MPAAMLVRSDKVKRSKSHIFRRGRKECLLLVRGRCSFHDGLAFHLSNVPPVFIFSSASLFSLVLGDLLFRIRIILVCLTGVF